MPHKSEPAEYLRSFRALWEQKDQLFYGVAMLCIVLVYASGLQNPTTQKIFYYMAAGLALSYVFALVSAALHLHRVAIQSKGLRATAYGVTHKQILWKDVETLQAIAIGRSRAVGINYKSPGKNVGFLQKMRQRSFGYDEVIANAHNPEGDAFVDDVVDAFKQYKDMEKKRG